MVIDTRRITAGVGDGDAVRIPLCRDQGRGAAAAAGIVQGSEYPRIVDREFRAGHRDVRRDHLLAAVHAGRAGDFGDEIGIAADAADAGRGHGKYSGRAVDLANRQIQNPGDCRRFAYRHRDDPVRQARRE